MSALQTVPGTASHAAYTDGQGEGRGTGQCWRVAEESHKFKSESCENQSSFSSMSGDHSLVTGVTDTGTVPTVTKLLSSGQISSPSDLAW